MKIIGERSRIDGEQNRQRKKKVPQETVHARSVQGVDTRES
jgi:hypothetical protein